MRIAGSQRTRALSDQIDSFLWERIGFPGRHGAKRDACASGERRNEPGGPIRPTEGRVFLRRGGVALLCRWHRIAMRSAPGHDTKSS
ncbi:MAG: hypothetical protein V3V34_07690, partial [Kiloniellales bacterium]